MASLMIATETDLILKVLKIISFNLNLNQNLVRLTMYNLNSRSQNSFPNLSVSSQYNVELWLKLIK